VDAPATAPPAARARAGGGLAAVAARPPPGDAPALVIHAGVAASGGTSPTLAPGFVAGAALERPRWSAGLEVRGDAATEVALATGAVRTQLTTLAAVPCARRGAASACAVASLGLVRAEGTGFDGARSVMSPLFAAGGRLGARARLADGWAVHASLEALAVVAGAGVRVDDMVVWETGRVTTTFAISASYQIP